MQRKLNQNYNFIIVHCLLTLTYSCSYLQLIVQVPLTCCILCRHKKFFICKWIIKRFQNPHTHEKKTLKPGKGASTKSTRFLRIRQTILSNQEYDTYFEGHNYFCSHLIFVKSKNYNYVASHLCHVQIRRPLLEFFIKNIIHSGFICFHRIVC